MKFIPATLVLGGTLVSLQASEWTPSHSRPSDNYVVIAVPVPMPAASPVRAKPLVQKADWTGGDVFGRN